MSELKKALVAVSFGSTMESALATIGRVEDALCQCSDRQFFRAFSGNIVRRRLAERGIRVESPAQLLERLISEGYSDIVLQPTYVIPGTEFDKVLTVTEGYRDKIASLKIGAPLVCDAEALTELADLLRNVYLAGVQSASTGLLLMGHGTEHLANFIFPALQTAMRTLGENRAYVATVEGWPALSDAVDQMKRDGIETVIAAPFLLAAGDHVMNDLQGEREDSWKNVLIREGFVVDCRCTGLGELAEIREMYCRHALKLMEKDA